MSATSNQSNLEAAIGKLHAFCSKHSLLKSDEQLSVIYEGFFAVNHDNPGTTEKKGPHQNFEALEGMFSVLYELEAYLMVQSTQQAAQEIRQGDTGNRLFASLKRHPE